MRFAVAGFDELSGLSESLHLDFMGVSLLGCIYNILEEPTLSVMSSATFEYTRQKIGLSDGFLQERFYGNVDSLQVMSVPELSSLILFLTGAAGLFFKQGRRLKIHISFLCLSG